MPSHNVPPLQDITVFVAVAESSSFTRAAEKLGTSKSNAGKAVQRLESRLGTRLFQRTTRAVRLTEDGETYLQAARMALEGLDEAEGALAARRSEPAGRVRLDLPAGLGRLVLPTLLAIRARYPKVTFEVSLTDRQADAVGEGWDIVVRIGALPDAAGLTVRRLCTLREGLYAAPAYLKQKGAVASAQALQGHDAAVFRSASGALRRWRLKQGSGTIEILPTAKIILSDGQALVDAAIAGLGIAQIFDKVARPHVQAGALIQVLPESEIDGPSVHALIPVGHRMPRKTKVVLEHLADVLKGRAPR